MSLLSCVRCLDGLKPTPLTIQNVRKQCDTFRLSNAQAFRCVSEVDMLTWGSPRCVNDRHLRGCLQLQGCEPSALPTPHRETTTLLRVSLKHGPLSNSITLFPLLRRNGARVSLLPSRKHLAPSRLHHRGRILPQRLPTSYLGS